MGWNIPGLNIGGCKGFMSSPKGRDLPWGPLISLFNFGGSFPRVKRSWRDADHLPASGVEVKNE